MVSAQPVLVHGIILSQMQNFAFAFVDLHELFFSIFLQFVKTLLRGSHAHSILIPLPSLVSFASLIYFSLHFVKYELLLSLLHIGKISAQKYYRIYPKPCCLLELCIERWSSVS